MHASDSRSHPNPGIDNVPSRSHRLFPAGAALVIGVLAISWGSILVRLCDAPSLGIAFYRLLFSTILVALPGWHHARPGVGVRTYLLAIAAGFLLSLHFALWISSLAYTTVASSVVLVSTQPVFTAVLGPFLLRENPGARGWAAVALALTGSAILAGGDWRLGESALFGDALALGGALTASVYLMIGRCVRERIGFWHYIVVVYGTAAASLGWMAVAAGTDLGGYPSATWLWLVLLAIGPNLMGHGLLNWSVRHLRALVVNLAVLGEPVLATIYAAILFAEIPGWAFYAGSVPILTGILLAVREGQRGYNRAR